MAITREEAIARAETIRPVLCCVELDLRASAHTFESRSRLLFDAVAGAETFVDLDARELIAAELNGEPLSLDAVHGRRLHLRGLRAENELVVTSIMTYGRDGQGLHRASDPVDGEDYVYGHLFLDAAPRVFACFDQPDLKSPLEMKVRAPLGWTVLGNGAMREVEPGLWCAERTPPLATYFMTVCAGPYVSVWDEHDGIPLALHARSSLQGELEGQAAEIFAVTRASFDYYHSLFGLRFPFGQYHQVFVPEFNAGAMENPGCVTFREQLLFTGAASRAEHLARASTIAHEMAHMWFGDLVTMRWWDDLWLNESFAEYMATRTLVAGTDYDDAWVAVAAGRKAWGYSAERSPSTHPVAGAHAPDTDVALQNFDGISYAKGSAVLRQLILHIGDDAFISGVRMYLKRHAFGNASYSDFIMALEEASGRDLGVWSAAWLGSAGMDTIKVDRLDPEGPLVVFDAPATSGAVREHYAVVTAYDESGTEIMRDELVSGSGKVTLSPLPAQPLATTVIVPNAEDLTWAGVELDDVTVGALPTVLPQIKDPVTRAVVWTALGHGLATAAVSAEQILGIACLTLPRELQTPILESASGLLVADVVGRYLPWSARENAGRRLAALGEELLAAGNGDDDPRRLAGARLVAATGSIGRVRPWFEGIGLPAAVGRDALFRWRLARRLAALDAVSVDELDQALAADATLSGRLGYLTARACFPSAEVKEWAWEELTASPEAAGAVHSNYEMNAIAAGFWSAREESTLTPFIERYVRDIPRMRGWVGEDALARVTATAFPAGLASEHLDVETRRMLQHDLPGAVRRVVVDQQARVREVLASRVAFPG